MHSQASHDAHNDAARCSLKQVELLTIFGEKDATEGVWCISQPFLDTKTLMSCQNFDEDRQSPPHDYWAKLPKLEGG